jgi:hypothetical protein
VIRSQDSARVTEGNQKAGVYRPWDKTGDICLLRTGDRKRAFETHSSPTKSSSPNSGLAGTGPAGRGSSARGLAAMGLPLDVQKREAFSGVYYNGIGPGGLGAGPHMADELTSCCRML